MSKGIDKIELIDSYANGGAGVRAFIKANESRLSETMKAQLIKASRADAIDAIQKASDVKKEIVKVDDSLEELNKLKNGYESFSSDVNSAIDSIVTDGVYTAEKMVQLKEYIYWRLKKVTE